MDQRLTALERAFQLAKSGQAKNVGKIKIMLQREGYDFHQLDGPSLRRQLKKMIEDSSAPIT